MLLSAAIDWNGAKGAAFAVLGSSSLAVIGFYVAILNLREIKIVVQPEPEAKPIDSGETKPKVAPPAE